MKCTQIGANTYFIGTNHFKGIQLNSTLFSLFLSLARAPFPFIHVIFCRYRLKNIVATGRCRRHWSCVHIIAGYVCESCTNPAWTKSNNNNNNNLLYSSWNSETEKEIGTMHPNIKFESTLTIWLSGKYTLFLRLYAQSFEARGIRRIQMFNRMHK